MNALVVDDNPVNLLLAAKLLEELGFNVASANSAQAAIYIFLQGKFEVILMDYQMPEIVGSDAIAMIRGYELDYKKVLSFIVAVSGERTPLKVLALMNAGANRFLPKPLQLEDLQRVLLAGKSRRTVS